MSLLDILNLYPEMKSFALVWHGADGLLAEHGLYLAPGRVYRLTWHRVQLHQLLHKLPGDLGAAEPGQ